MPSKYTIHHAGSKSVSHDLLGLEIEQTADGFVLVAPRRELSAVSLVNLHGKPLMKFHVKDFQGFEWTIFVNQMSPSELRGTWCNGKDCVPGLGDEADSWTASGSGAGEPGDDEPQSKSAGYHSH